MPSTFSRKLLAPAFVLTALAGLLASAPASAAEEPVAPAAEEENAYARAGLFEVGGSVSGGWSPSLFTLAMSPSVGYFLRDRFELSLLGVLAYENLRADDGTRADELAFNVLLEPSYHHPVSKMLALFGGLGAGVAFTSDRTAFDLAPRVGLNIEVGRAGVLTPEISVPILFGGQSDPDAASVTASLIFGAGFTTTF